MHSTYRGVHEDACRPQGDVLNLFVLYVCSKSQCETLSCCLPSRHFRCIFFDCGCSCSCIRGVALTSIFERLSSNVVCRVALVNHHGRKVVIRPGEEEGFTKMHAGHKGMC